jgi:multidrug resistance efflux pump
VLTVPLAEQGQLIGAITLESQRSACFDTDRIALMEQLGAEAGPLLKLKWALDRPLLARCVTAVRQALSGKPGTSSRRAQVGAAALAALLAIAFAVLPLPHHVSGPARLEAMTQRVISAPVDGYLKQVHVRPGDRVTAQQVLAELNDEPLRTEHRRLTAEFMQHQNALADAMVKANRTQVMVHSAKLDELTAQIDLLEQQLQHTRLRAPFDGVVIKGDLTQMLGTPIKRSDVLLTLSQGTEFRVLVDVGERDIEDVKVGRRGTLVLAAHPAQPLAVQVVRVAPVANVTEEGQNAFEVEAAIESNVIPLAPGLKGSVKIESDARPFGWHWATRAWHALKYAIWSRL